MKPSKPKLINVKADELEPFLQRAKAVLNEEDYETFKALVESYVYVTQVVEDKRTTIGRLRKLLFGSSTEKTRAVIKADAEATGPQAGAAEDGAGSPEGSGQDQEASKGKGHGRNGADAYRGAAKIRVPHESLKPGARCPDCKQGKVYEVAKPGVLVRIVGQAPMQAKVYELQKLRCNLCGKVLTARAPEGVGSQKYDATSASMIALLKYGSGLPFNRLEGLQGSLGIPLPASTQWDIVRGAAQMIEPVYDELIRQAAQGEVLYNDDTTMKILEFMGERAKARVFAEDTPKRKGKSPPRKGVFTSGIVSTNEGRRIALFFTGRRHAGENLAQVLAHRSSALGPPIQMCDALSRNLPAELKTIVGNCLAHGRRQFVDVVERFPEECRYVLEILGKVYKNDAVARGQNLSLEERLRFHQAKSEPLMVELKAWLIWQFEDRLVEPNSALGEAISYMVKHWEKLTLFLRKPGAPLDNNICEQALKKAILHRKNALFYKTENGAHVGDLFMSLIHTCHLGGVNPFDYLTTLQKHAEELSSDPEKWMPWNYREMLEPAGPTTDPRDALPHTAR
jgi:transposase